MTKEILIFVGGVALGAASMFFAVKKHYETLCNEEIEDMRAHFEQKYGKNDVSEDKIEVLDGTKPLVTPTKSKFIREEERKPFVREESKTYTDKTDAEEDSYEDKAGDKHPILVHHDEPYIVDDTTIDDYTGSFETYTFSYYNGSDTFINEDNVKYSTVDKDEEIEDIDYYIGADIHDKLLQNLSGAIIPGRKLEKAETITVRNESIGAEIEIIWYPYEYEEE